MDCRHNKDTKTCILCNPSRAESIPHLLEVCEDQLSVYNPHYSIKIILTALVKIVTLLARLYTQHDQATWLHK
jgi:hypothetical protein